MLSSLEGHSLQRSRLEAPSDKSVQGGIARFQRKISLVARRAGDPVDGTALSLVARRDGFSIDGTVLRLLKGEPAAQYTEIYKDSSSDEPVGL